MLAERLRRGSQRPVHSLYRKIWLCVMWAHAATTLAQPVVEEHGTNASATTGLALIPSETPSAPEFSLLASTQPFPTGLIPSSSRTLNAELQALATSVPFPSGLIPSSPRPPDAIPEAPATAAAFPTGLIPSESPAAPPGTVSSSIITTAAFPTGLIPSAPPAAPPNTAGTYTIPSEAKPPSALPSSASSGPQIITNLPPSFYTTIGLPSSANATKLPPTYGSMPPVTNSTIPVPGAPTSTTEGLRPIPAPSVTPGDPNGHHEISEINFSSTVSCRGCSPALEIPATGWGDSLPPSQSQVDAQPQETPQAEPSVSLTITAGPSVIVIKPRPTASGSAGQTQSFVIGDSTTITLGQTITVDKTPIFIETSASRTQIIIGGTQTILVTAPAQATITEPPLVPLPVTIGSQTLTPVVNSAKSAYQQTPALYIIEGQTLLPGGSALTISGTTFSLPSSPTAIVVNGKTTTVTPEIGAVVTKTTVPYLTLFASTYTANAAGNYVIAPGTTLRPGGEAITVSGTRISLLPENTEVLVQGSTSFMAPRTTIVTATRSSGDVYMGTSTTQSGTAAPTLPLPGGACRTAGHGALAEGFFVMSVFVVGWLAVRL